MITIEAGDYMLPETKHSVHLKERSTKRQYRQKYRSVWETDPRFRGWIEPLEDDDTKARCSACGVTVQAHIKSLVGHGDGKRHREVLITKGIALHGSRDFINNPSSSSGRQNDIADSLLTAVASIEEQCHTYAGGSVYPNTEGRASGHKLQWTKALISKPAPNWDATAVVDGQFKQLKLSDFLGKYVVFFFYPLDFTFVCPTEILAFNDRLSEFQRLNTAVIACSIDSHFTHYAWTKTPRKKGGLGDLKIPLVSDITHSIAQDYGVYLEDQGVALRGLFIIDDKGILRQITMNDLPVGRSIDETLRLVEAFQFTDKHGEVCPAGWKPGDATIIPTPEDSQRYFSKANEEM